MCFAALNGGHADLEAGNLRSVEVADRYYVSPIVRVGEEGASSRHQGHGHQIRGLGKSTSRTFTHSFGIGCSSPLV